MSLDQFTNLGWRDHVDQTAAVAARLPEGIAMAEKPEQLIALANLATHVFGEHLGQWYDGRAFIRRLRENSLFSAGSELESALKKMDKSLELNINPHASVEALSMSEQVGALCIASSAQLVQKNLAQARMFFERALKMADQLDTKDPANRNVAVTCNNLASVIEDKKTPVTAEEIEFMLRCGLMSRKYWELAGTWINVERADYFMVARYTKAGRMSEALKSAQSCVDICLQNKADDFETFFAYECLVRGYKAVAQDSEQKKAFVTMMSYFDKLTDSQKKTAQGYLDKISFLNQ